MLISLNLNFIAMKKLVIVLAATLLATAPAVAQKPGKAKAAPGQAKNAAAQASDQQLTEQTVSRAKLESHIRFLAADELRGRDTPSPEQLIAAKYLATQLQSYGVKPLAAYPNYLQPVAMKNQTKPTSLEVAYADKKFVQGANLLMIEGSNRQVQAEAVYLNWGTEADFANVDVKGKLVLVKAGTDGETSPQQWFFEGRAKRARATKAGAVGLVEFYSNPTLPWKILANYLNTDRLGVDEAGATATEPLAHLWLNDPDLKEALAWQDRKTAPVTLAIGGMKVDRFNTYNVVGYLEGTDPKLKDEYVVYSAHYDHIGVGRADEAGDTIYNGARDNAIGTVTVLSAAENLGRYPTKRSALFVLFTGEEKGLLGSAWFVEHSPVELKKLVYCFNSDNGGYNDVTRATIIGLGRTTADGLIKTACQAFGLAATDDPAPEQGLFDRSDNVNFAKKGIPAPTFSLGFKAFDDEIGKYYHQPGDQPDNLDYEYLHKFFRAYVYACRLIGNAPARPFWKPGDKYHDVGVSLYR
jgi:aminopeptidase YwaD